MGPEAGCRVGQGGCAPGGERRQPRWCGVSHALVTLHQYHTEGSPLRLHLPLSFDGFLSVPFLFLVCLALLDCP